MHTSPLGSQIYQAPCSISALAKAGKLGYTENGVHRLCHGLFSALGLHGGWVRLEIAALGRA